MVEGGNKPNKPDENLTYKIITNYVNYPMTEKREKYYNIVNTDVNIMFLLIIQNIEYFRLNQLIEKLNHIK